MVVAQRGREGGAEAGGRGGFPARGARPGTEGGGVDLVVGCWRALLGLEPGGRGAGVAAAAGIPPDADEQGEEGEAAEGAADDGGERGLWGRETLDCGGFDGCAWLGG